MIKINCFTCEEYVACVIHQVNPNLMKYLHDLDKNLISSQKFLPLVLYFNDIKMMRLFISHIPDIKKELKSYQTLCQTYYLDKSLSVANQQIKDMQKLIKKKGNQSMSYNVKIGIMIIQKSHIFEKNDKNKNSTKKKDCANKVSRRNKQGLTLNRTKPWNA
ncbi:hypothetical protein TRFO_31545 [Tritrichomonas foetus]|uniref:Uncharacterized protein n=1 Tax=Tritrichomonas foetus TaxID=1144522 RepID=A0A1J4JVK9_9EUKA|nr:hypothetical protein TRFO_31545 [Tritrichomonas foetus]|eukprot:OHT01566.1 hypothetical protein TRFO_31545 [Tritrichomonas foetus]